MICPNCQVKCLPYGKGNWSCPKCEFTAPENKWMIEHCFMLVSMDPSGFEGIVCVDGGEGKIIPLIGSHPKDIEKFKAFGQRMLKNSSMKSKLLKFTHREVLESIE